MNDFGHAYLDEGDYAQDEAHYKHALSIGEAKLANDHPQLGVTIDGLAALYARQGKYVESGAYNKRAQYAAQHTSWINVMFQGSARRRKISISTRSKAVTSRNRHRSCGSIAPTNHVECLLN